jgi:hypothetical protein
MSDHEEPWDSSDGEVWQPPSNVVGDPEEWMDYHSEFLVPLWHALKDHVASMGVYILDACSIGDFTEFCFKHSSGRKPPC